MTKAEFIAATAAQFGLTKKLTGEILENFTDRIGKHVVQTGRFSWPGFGTWTIRTRKARKIRNPQTEEIMNLGATKTIGFRPAKELKATFQAKKRRAA